jgi:hypothetical protein
VDGQKSNFQSGFLIQLANKLLQKLKKVLRIGANFSMFSSLQMNYSDRHQHRVKSISGSKIHYATSTVSGENKSALN